MGEYIYRELTDDEGNIVGREYGGRLTRCKYCDHNQGGTWVDCKLLPQMFGRSASENYCSLSAPKEEEPNVSEG